MTGNTARRLAVGLLGILSLPVARAQDSPPDGFVLTEYASGLTQPTAMAFTPDGRLWVAEKNGAVRVIHNGVLEDEPLVTVDVFNFSECGLLGLAPDPDFATNGYLYAFATVSADEQRILRISVSGNTATSVETLVDNLPTEGVNHDGGCVRVGPDNHLYFSIGDNGIPALGQDMNSLAGKIGRLRLDGTVPNDNPFTTPTGTKRATYALGFRNPFRFCFANDGRMFVMDVGSNGDARREEINLVRAGGNHGWPEVEGIGDDGDSGFTNPVHAYHDEGQSIAGCAVYEHDAFPAEYRGNLFHLDFVSNSLFRVVLDGDGMESHSLMLRADGGPVDLTVGPDGALYFAELYSGRIMRLAYDGDGPDPVDPPTDGSDTGVTPPQPRLCGILGLGMFFAVFAGLVGTRIVVAQARCRRNEAA